MVLEEVRDLLEQKEAEEKPDVQDNENKSSLAQNV